MSQKEEQGQSPAQFLAEVATALKEKEGADKDLAAILGENILVETPKDKAVSDAKAAIIALAVKRAEQPVEAGDA